MSADWPVKLHKAREMLTEQFKQEVEKELTGRETEPWEIVYFKLYSEFSASVRDGC
jgi:hypothetical protein